MIYRLIGHFGSVLNQSWRSNPTESKNTWLITNILYKRMKFIFKKIYYSGVLVILHFQMTKNLYVNEHPAR